MRHVIYEFAGILVLLATLPLTLELLVLSIAAILPFRPARVRSASNFRLAVIVPAHNEEKLIANCIRSLLACRQVPAEVFVVAHNCTDRTAELASAAGARVLPLSGPGGKGLALDHGFRHALALGADAVLVVDADSIVSRNLVSTVVKSIRAGSEAVQACYQAANPAVNQRTRVAALSLFGMNVVRPRGRARLGFSCGIFGNGFALSSATLHRVPYTANSLVEDLEYHLRLVRAGIKVQFLHQAAVYGEMPEHSSAASTQRARWEGGRAHLRRTLSLRLLRQVLRGRLSLTEPLLDLLALPLATQLPVLLLACALPLLWLRVYSVVGLFSAVLYLAVSCFLGPGSQTTFKALLAVPGYMFWKVIMIPRTLLAARHNTVWVRTERNQ